MDYGNRRNQGGSYSEQQVKRVLVGSGIDIERDLDNDFIIFCPFHGNFRTPAGEVNKENGLFFCFSCQHTADLIELVMHVTKRTYFESIRFINSKSVETDFASDVMSKLKDKPDFVPFDDVLIKRLSVEALASPRAMRYFEGRKITEDSVKKFSLGYSQKQDMITIPVTAPDGMMVGFVGRSVEGKEFKNTTGLPKSKTLFNLHRVKTSKQVYVVESSFDAIRLDQCGMPAVATLGANVSNKQIELLRQYFNEIFVIADNDEAGGNMSERIVERLGGRVLIINIDKKYKDIGDMDDESIRNLNYEFDKSIAAMLN
jgi:DNA primase